MAVTTATASTPLVETIVTDTTSDVTIETAATATQKLYFIEIDNPNGDAVYTKVFNTASGATVATQHYLQLYCPANTTCYMYIPTSLTIANGIQFYTSLVAGKTQTQTEPISAVNVVIGCTTS
tara:strand:+ start:95 stop:463 length:369 start_codon:yes stop_codon:yes gene_type:complete